MGVVLVVALVPSVGSTQSPEDLKAVLRELESIRKELAELKALVQRQGPAQPAAPRVAAIGATVTVAGAPFKGRADAPVTIVEFSDYQCPFCSRHVKQTMPELEKEYIETGKVKYVFRNYPIESLHPLAFKAAEAAECANEQGQFWPMHDGLFANQQLLAPPQLPIHAATAGVGNPGAFQQCLASGKFAPRIRKDISDASAVGITGTPGFLLGKTVVGNPTVKVDAFISGARPFAGFKIEIDKLLGQ
jgi:protein-disulfide isomerase